MTLLLLLWYRCVFCMSVFFLSGFALSRSTLHMRLRLLLHDQIPRYRRLYHFVGIRDWWSAIIVDTLFGGQLIHSYIKDINTSLTYHFWLSGYPASSFIFDEVVASVEFSSNVCCDIFTICSWQKGDRPDNGNVEPCSIQTKKKSGGMCPAVPRCGKPCFMCGVPCNRPLGTLYPLTSH